MKTISMLALAIVGTGILATVFLTGCSGGENSMDEPDPMTVAHLSEKYAAQLVRDGADTLFGTIGITEGEDGTVWVDIFEMEYVEDQNQPSGYYIADKNLESMYQLSPDARATFLAGGSSIAQVMDAGEFAAAAMQGADELSGKLSLYYIYIIDDQVELLIARYIP
ncbi:MAG: hypothetical protein FWG42_11015 [Clostridiales bacterium]|nr:hypothetical protein [Clostridiales bacterium]